ncbi:MAG: hypothetical protein ACOCWH_00555 [Spirochaetota bacterium]
MRADIQHYFTLLNDLYGKKLTLYRKLAENTEECNFHIVSGNIDRIDEKLEESNEVISYIDEKDYEITQIKSEICRLAGIEYYQFERSFLDRVDNELTVKTRHLLDEMKQLMRRSIDNRDMMIRKLHEKQAKISSSIHSIARTRALNTRFRIMHY